MTIPEIPGYTSKGAKLLQSIMAKQINKQPILEKPHQMKYTNKALYELLLKITNHYDAYDFLADAGYDPHEDAPTVPVPDEVAKKLILATCF